MYFSTRNRKLRFTASQVILQGLSDDGGLFLPESFHPLAFDDALLNLSYPQLAFRILKPYLDDFTDEEVSSAVNSAYDSRHFEEKIMDVTTFGNHSIMELFHGQTLTFKDMALSLLPYLMEISKAKHPDSKPIKILTATSGDTGSAVLSSFAAVRSIDVSILYPHGGISPLQEKQMLYFTSDHSRAYALKDSNFDDCQSFVKAMLVSHEKEGYTSANSINVGRLLPQIVYYYFSYALLVKRHVLTLGEPMDVIVPTGNFGDIFAGYLAKRMGLPIGKLIVASNTNRILTDFFTTGVYDLHRDFRKTNSPSMDILISSNLERLLYCLYEDSDKVASLMKDLKEKKVFRIEKAMLGRLQETFKAYSCDEEMTKKTIRDCYRENNYLLDPHSAVAYQCYRQYALTHPKNHCLVIATASPLKFAGTICESLGLDYPDDNTGIRTIIETANLTMPHALKKVLDCHTPRELICRETAENVILNKHGYQVQVPATSANVGPGFDVLGLALDRYNVFEFTKAGKNSLIGFGSFNTPDNLVLTSYQYAFRAIGMEPVPVCIRQIRQDIPLERGMGSSSGCIIAGLVGANEILHHRFSREDLYQMAVRLEGHPDNVAPCLFGGLVGNVRLADGSYHPESFPVHGSLSFVLAVPAVTVKTEHARAVMPATYTLEDVRFNLSRIALLPKALESGDLALLKDLMEDRIHVPYRKALIPCYDALKALSDELGLPFTISGSGSAMIYIVNDKTRDSLVNRLSAMKTAYGFDVVAADLDNIGASAKEYDL